MIKADKVKVVDEIKGALTDADGFVLLSFKGLGVIEFEELRGKIREVGGKAKVYKNRLIRIALNDSGVTAMDGYLKQDTAVVYSKDDVMPVLKVVAEFAKANEKVTIKGSYISGEANDATASVAISQLPGKKQLYGMIAGGISSIVGNFAGALNSIMTTFVGTIEAVEKKKGE